MLRRNAMPGRNATLGRNAPLRRNANAKPQRPPGTMLAPCC